MSKNIMKKTARHIYYGIDAQTGALHHISEVSSGKQCNCICTFCKQPFEARKGSIRQHHFAHVSNYDCMYSSEVAIYRAFANCLECRKTMKLPAIMLRFPAWNHGEILRESQELLLDSVTFECENFAYPPMLKVRYEQSELRILLNFNYYYDSNDLRELSSAACNENYSILMYHLPSVTTSDNFTPEKLAHELDSTSNAEWVFSRLEEQWKERYAKYAIEPATHGSGYLCPISIGYYKGKYSARWTDCAYCKFNIALPPGCLCVAKAGIQTHQDFRRSQAERTAAVDNIRFTNEAKIRNAQRSRYVQPNAKIQRVTFLRTPEQIKLPESPKPTTSRPEPLQSELDAAFEEIANNFNADSVEWTVDRFNRRWIQCQKCGKIKQDAQMASYGGINGMNRGICAACSRKIE